ncbi:MAG: aromatic aminobenezylarsenical efflux permease ArsG family transporter [Elusimicrobiales bacterium]|nr:aromatic aminobenezylarsenical efflux permease ArsG family transporter [Elusimicrobiales bacterium]
MKAELWGAAFTALWTGMLTSVSPCPLATNIAALGYISKQSGSHKLAVLAHGGLYALGRALAYAAVGFLIVRSLLSAPAFSFFMQRHGGQLLSPLLVLAGMYMLGLVGSNFSGFDLFAFPGFRARAGAVSTLLMGFLFALAFCPVSAALYFGIILPLAAKTGAPLTLPLLYGLGTALPVAGMALALDLGLRKIPAVTGLAGKFERRARPATGWVFVAAGVYLGLKDIFGVI